MYFYDLINCPECGLATHTLAKLGNGGLKCDSCLVEEEKPLDSKSKICFNGKDE